MIWRYAMLEKLRIQNYAIIEQLEIELPNGFIVITGETGAGKSIIFDAIQLLQGGRANSDMIRSGKHSAVIEGTYVLSPSEYARMYPLLLELGCCDFDHVDHSRQTGKNSDIYHKIDAAICTFLNGMEGYQEISQEVLQDNLQMNNTQNIKLENMASFVEELGILFEQIPREERTLDIRRTISRSGSGRISINGTRISVKNLQSIMDGVVDIIGQHASHDLLQASNHIGILDAFAGTTKEANFVSKKVTYLHKLRQELQKLQDEKDYRNIRMKSLQKQFDEIEMAQVSEGEDERLEQQLDRLSNAEMIKERTMNSVYLLQDGEGSSVDHLNIAIDQLRRIAYLDPILEQSLETLERCNIEISEVSRDIRRFSEEVIVSPDEIAFLQERLELIRVLKTRHGSRLEDILQAQISIQHELDTLTGQEDRIKEVEKEISKLEKELMNICVDLSHKRQNAGKRLGEIVEQEIQTLGMPNCRFDVAYRFVGWDKNSQSETVVSAVESACTSSLTNRGLDNIEFLIAPNIGEEFKSLARIASGGELSRLLLALKGALISTDPVETYIFDEVDTGIGGGVAESVGRKLQKLGTDRQVLCITHLPQVASCGHYHLYVSKKLVSDDSDAESSKNYRTVSSLHFMSVSERIQEIARMLGGAEVTDRTIAHAQELLQQNQGILRLVQNIS